MVVLSGGRGSGPDPEEGDVAMGKRHIQCILKLHLMAYIFT